MTLSVIALGGLALFSLAALIALMFVLAGIRQGRLAKGPAALLAACVLAVAGLAVIRGHDQGVEACAQQLRRLGAALELYGRNHDGTQPESLQVLVPVYFTALPQCPVAPDSYLAGYTQQDGAFTVVCSGHHHPGLGGTAADYPRFTYAQGIVLRP